jgi:hypothetical protein
MPLLDHFRDPLRRQRPWDGFHGSWAAKIADGLNQDELPDDYFAMPSVTVGGQFEVDVGTFHGQDVSGNGPAATAVLAPVKPALTAFIDLALKDSFEVQIFQELGGPQLCAAVELVSPANKDRPSHRRAFAIKCAAYLQRNVSVIIVDMVSDRAANLHDELAGILQLPHSFLWQSATGLFAAAYRISRTPTTGEIDAWPETLTVGKPLPTLPLWLDMEAWLPLDLEKSYLATCASLRIQVAT